MNSSKWTATKGFLNAVNRSSDDRWLGGVCGGFAAQSGVPAWVFRVLVIVLMPAGGVLIYLALWICMSAEPAFQPASRLAPGRGHVATAE